MEAIDYKGLFGTKKTSKKPPTNTNMNNKDKQDIHTLKEEMAQKLKKDPELAQKAAQLIIDMLNSKKKEKDK